MERIDIQAAGCTPERIEQAARRIQPYALKTPLLYSAALSEKTGLRLYLKMECWQTCGSFKIRGISNFLERLEEAKDRSRLVTASSGNHGLALAYMSRLRGRAPVRVFVPQNAEQAKVDKLRLFGAETVRAGKDFFAALDRAQSYAREQGCLYVHSHAHPDIIAGQGSIGLEILADLPDAECIVVPIGGGGLVAGIAASVKAGSPQTRILGVEPEAAPGAFLSLKENRSIERIPLRPSLADGLLGGFSPLCFAVAGSLIESVSLVSEAEIKTAMRSLLEEEQILVEGSAAAGLAAILAGKIEAPGKKVVLVLTGRNIAADKFLTCIKGGR
jgi:threonine dehydratase